jgi:hypothetical protein
MRAKQLVDLLDAEQGAGHLMVQAKLLLRIRKAANEVLPRNLQRSCAIANLRQGTVVIFAENTAMAAKLRLFGPTLLERWAQQGLNVTGIQVEAQVRTAAQTEAPKAVSLSPSAGEALRELETTLPDSPLKENVGKLAKRASRPD